MCSSTPRQRSADQAGRGSLALIIVILVVAVAVLMLGGIDLARTACVSVYSALVAVELAVLLLGAIRVGPRVRRRPLPPPVSL